MRPARLSSRRYKDCCCAWEAPSLCEHRVERPGCGEDSKRQRLKRLDFDQPRVEVGNLCAEVIVAAASALATQTITKR